MKSRWIFLFLILSYCCIVKAQPGNPFIPVSSISLAPTAPQAYQFQKFTEMPMDVQSGIPQINIPFHSIKLTDVSWDLGIRYNAGGFKTSEMATPSGLGWTFEGNAIITSTVVGTNDLVVPIKEDSMIMRRILDLAGSTVNFNCEYNNTSDIGRAASIIAGIDNFQPDLYHLSMPGKSLKFFIYRDTGYAVPATNDIILVKRFVSGSQLDSARITLQDSRGVRYYFTYKGFNKSSSGCNYGRYRISMSESPIFYIDSIKNLKGETISFSYHLETYTYTTAPSIGYNEKATVEYPCGNYNPGQYAQLCENTFTAKEAVLDRIVSTVGDTIDLKYSSRLDITGSGKLDTLVLGNAGFKHKVLFYNSYFGNSSRNNLRLRLDSLASLDLNTGSTSDIYRFQYNAIELPSIASLSFDYYGYYNGASNGGTNPAQFIRDPILPNAKACVMERMIYPSGGVTDFNYEYDDYKGGLRINSIENRTSTAPSPMNRRYEYITNNSLLYPSFRTTQSSIHVYTISGSITQDYTYCSYYRHTSQAATGSVYGRVSSPYTKVIEYYGYNGEFGKVEYDYQATQNYIYNNIAFPKQLTLKTTYSRVNTSEFRKIKEESFIYGGGYDATLNSGETGMFSSPRSKKEKRIWGIFVSKIQEETSVRLNELQSKCIPERYTQEHYALCSFPQYLTGKKVKEYSYTENNVVSITTEEKIEYQSDFHNEPTRIIEIDSRNDSNITAMIYAPDYLPGNPMLESLKSNNIIAVPLEIVKYKSKSDGTQIFQSASLTEFNEIFLPNRSFYCGKSSGFLLSGFKFSNAQPGQLPYSGSLQSYQPDNSYELEEIVTKLQNNRIVEVVNRKQSVTSYCYDDFGRITAAIQNGKSSEVAFNSFESSGSSNLTFPGSPVKGNAFTGSYSYPLTGNSINANNLPANKTYIVSYWTESGEKNVNNIPGVNKQTLGNWKYFEHIVTPANGQVNIQGSGLIDEIRITPINAQMITYSYEFQGRIAAQVDINNSPTYYEYDGLGKLIHIRDREKNIIRKFEYNLTGSYGIANWQQTGNKRCVPCMLNMNFKDPVNEIEYIDVNPNSGSFNSVKWVKGSFDANCTTGDIIEASAPFCETENGVINGYLITQTKNINPCSQQYNVVVTKREINLSACPFICNSTTCSGPDKKCINGVCETAVIKKTAMTFDGRLYHCTYSYVWSDGTTAFFEIRRSPSPC